MDQGVGNIERGFDRETVFHWRIQNFSDKLEDVDYRCSSPDFDFCGRDWFLAFYSNTREAHQAHGYCMVRLWCRERVAPLEFRVSVGIQSAVNGETEMEKTCTYTSEEEPFLDFRISEERFERSELLRRRDELFPGDRITVTLTLRATLPEEGTNDASVQAGVEETVEEDGNDQKREKTGTERIAEDVGKMWPDGDHCDVVIKVGDAEFKAHRAILSARTPALGAMFRHDMAEKASGEVSIEDCESAVFEQLLHFIYKGAPRELTAANAYSLYVLSDRYLVTELKALCLRYMMDTLCADNFCATVTVSRMHGEDALLQSAIEFFSRNMLRIVETVQWQTFMRDHSMWSKEILVRAAKIGIKSVEERRPDEDSSGT